MFRNRQQDSKSLPVYFKKIISQYVFVNTSLNFTT